MREIGRVIARRRLLKRGVVKCKHAQVLAIPYITGDLDTGTDLSRRLEAHLSVCTSCAAKSAEYRATIRFVEEHRSEFAAAFAVLDSRAEARQVAGRPKSCHSAPRRHGAASRARLGPDRMPEWLPAVAACLILGILTWLGDGLGGPESRAPHGAGEVTVADTTPGPRHPWGFSVEQVGPGSSVDLTSSAAGGVLRTRAGEAKTFLINRMHRLVVRGGTELMVAPMFTAADTGCLITLAGGELFAEVRRSAAPFVVQTAHGTAVITGTRFDVKATSEETVLVVAEGSVEFGGQQMVQVGPGQKSRIGADAIAVRPVSCDAEALVAWAADTSMPDESWQPNADWIPPNPLLYSAESIDLSAHDYVSWVDEKRNWFRREFPDILLLADTLAEEGVEADFPGLLLQSGVIWDFAYPPAQEQRLLPCHREGLVQAAQACGRDVVWLQNRGFPCLESSPHPQPVRGSEAFGAWRGDFAHAVVSGTEIEEDLLFASLHALVYLTNTRSLLWFAVTTNQPSSAGELKTSFQEALQRQVEAASRGAHGVLQLQGLEDRNWSCQSYAYRQLARGILEAIGEVENTEKELFALRARWLATSGQERAPR